MTIREIHLHHLSIPEKRAFEALFSKNDLSLFNPFLASSEYAVALAAFAKDKPVGLLYSYLYPAEAALMNFVLTDLEGGLELMQHFIKRLKKTGTRFATFSYPAYIPSASSIENILHQTKWAAPKLLTRRYYFNPSTFHPDWMNNNYQKSAYTLFEWETASPEDIAAAKQFQSHTPEIANHDLLTDIDKHTSLGIRKDGKLVGWLLTKRQPSNILCYVSLYLIPELRGRGQALYILRESISRHIQDNPDLMGCAEINFKLSSRSWVRFASRVLSPSAYHIEDINYSYLKLAAPD